MNKRIVGIDLGTTNSCVSVLLGTDKKPRVIENAEGNMTTPTIVAFVNDEIIVGRDAQRQAYKNPKGTFYAVKRLIGQKYQSILSWIKSLSYDVVEGENGEAVILHNNKQYKPAQILSYVLIYLMKQAQKYVETNAAVITVPAHFNEAQRQAIKDAAQIAGIDLQRIISEPTAAAIAYGIDKSGLKGKILVYDLGGGTFDVTLMSVEDQLFHVIQTGGDTFIGGENFDMCIANRLTTNFEKEHGKIEDATAKIRIIESAKQIKEDLSFKLNVDANIPYVALDKNKVPVNIEDNISRHWFNSVIEKDVNKTIEVLDEVISKSKVSYKDIDCVILVGGSVRIPEIANKIKAHTGLDVKLDTNPDTVVCIGAGIQGGIITGDVSDIAFVDVTPLDFGIETADGVFVPLIPSGTSIPTKKSKIFTTAHDNQTRASINIGQGARKFMKDNKQLGSFELKDIKPAPKGSPKIEVTFEIDANNTLKVHATEGGATANIELKADSGMSKEEIEKIKKEAEEMKDKDEAKEKCISIKHSIENTKKEAEDLIKKLTKEDQENYWSQLIELTSNSEKNIQDQNVSALENTEKKIRDLTEEIRKKTSNNKTEKEEKENKEENTEKDNKEEK